MKEKSIIIFSVIILLMINTLGFSQTKATPSRSSKKKMMGLYSVSNGAAGPQDVIITFEYEFFRESLVNKKMLGVDIMNITYEYTQGAGGKRYKYYGIMYTADELQYIDSRGQDCFGEIIIRDAAIVGLKVAGFSTEISDESLLHRTYGIGEISETKDLNTFSLSNTSASLHRVDTKNSDCIVERINNFKKTVSLKNQYKELILAGNEAFNAQNWSVAKSKYEKASQLIPLEGYPKDQLSRIKDKEDNIAKEKIKAAANAAEAESPSNSNGSNSGSPKSNSTNSGSSANQQNATGKTNNTGANAANSRAQSNGSTSENNNQNGAITNMSGTVKNNGEDIKVFQKNGKNYMQSANGNVRETSQEFYDGIQKASNKNIANEKKYEDSQKELKAAQTKSIQEGIDKQNKWTKDFNDRIDGEIEKNKKSAQLAQQSYYTAEAVQNAQSDINENMTLSGNYKTPEELEAEFNRKQAALNQSIANLAKSQNENLQATYNTYSPYRDANTEAIGQVGVGIINMINDAQVENEKREAQQQLQQQKRDALAEMERQKAQIERQKIAMRLEIRKSLFAQFREGGVPLSSTKTPSNELYFFSYIFDKTTIENGSPKILLSNVFPVGKYGDGTWPFKNALLNEINKVKQSGTTTLVGYYGTKEMAEGMHASFIRLASKSQMVTESFNYKGKPATSSSATSSDYWGNPTKGGEPKTNTETEETQEVKTNNSEVDFWGNPTKSGTKQSNEETNTIPQPKTSNSEVDFWGNPVKKGGQQQNTETPNKQEPLSPKAKVDFWGNPIKE
jgi:hypothetical protein